MIKFLFLISLSFLGGIVRAAPPEPTKILEMALSEVKPFAYKKGDVLHGINYDLAVQISKLSGVKFKYSLYPHMRLSNAVEELAPDVAFLFAPVCAKQNSYEPRGILYHIEPTLFLKESVSIHQKEIRIGRILGTCGAVKNKLLAPAITDISDMNQGIEMLRAGRLDGVCGLKPVVLASIDLRPKLKERLTTTLLPVKEMDAVLCVKKSLPLKIKEALEHAVHKSKVVGLD